MAEIRLICPGCAAEYLLPEGTIPARGRQVECTACGQVWQATPGDGPPDRPQTRPGAGAGAEQLSYTLAFGESAKVQRDPDRTDDAPQSDSAAAAPAAGRRGPGGGSWYCTQ